MFRKEPFARDRLKRKQPIYFCRPALDAGLGLSTASQLIPLRTRGGWVYIMANRYRGRMYVGVTADLTRRVYRHRLGEGSQHVADFGKTRIVFAERHDDIVASIAREKRLKKWRRHGNPR